MLNRLFEVVLIQVLRQLMERDQVQGGMLAGLAHPRLRFALVAMHESPAQEWSLEELGTRCGMSRSVFANRFRAVVGCTPGSYLQNWRITLAQRLLRRGRPLWSPRRSATAAKPPFPAPSVPRSGCHPDAGG